jgi:2-polyprenyl-3-methyl-5-hydroxy-6-metoxy-1,4-benzoquinol methylase
MSDGKAREFQNQSQIDDYGSRGGVSFGPWTSHIWRTDPRHLAFLMSRYKFISKMLAGREKAFEVGCGDAAGTPVVLQTVKRVFAIDFEPLVLEDARRRYAAEGDDRVRFAVHDICSAPVDEKGFNGAYCLDVIEHVPAEREALFMRNIVASLDRHGVFIIGTPNVTAQQYSSPASMEGHINLKSAKTLHELMAVHFHNVFDFSMNDEVVHTGYSPMAHYLFCMGVGVKS